MSICSRSKRIDQVFFATTIGLLALICGLINIREATGGEQTYIANILCSELAIPKHCEGMQTELKKGNPCINNLAKCVGEGTESDDLEKVGVSEPLYGADYRARSSPIDFTLGALTTNSFKLSLLMFLLASSSILAVFVLLFCMVDNKHQQQISIIIVLFAAIPAIWMHIGSLYPGINAALYLGIGIQLLIKLLNSEYTNRRNMSLTYFTGFASWTIGISSRNDIYLVGVVIFSIVLLFSCFNLIKTKKLYLKHIVTIILFMIPLYIFMPSAVSTQGKVAASIISANVTLSEAPETKALLEQGITQTGSVGQRIWYVVTAPVYYFQDWVKIAFNVGQLNPIASFLYVALLMLFLITIGQNIKLRAVKSVQLAIVIASIAGIVFLPAITQTGHIRIRYIAVFILLLTFAVAHEGVVIKRGTHLLRSSIATCLSANAILLTHKIFSSKGFFLSSVILKASAVALLMVLGFSLFNQLSKSIFETKRFSTHNSLSGVS